MRVKNIGDIIKQVKPLLVTYLRDSGVRFKSSSDKDNFQCPNFENHEKGGSDKRPSCGLLPDTNGEKFHCFTCGMVGDIFKAYSLIEGKDISGLGFHKAVQDLADRYKVGYELVEPTEEEQNFETVQKFLVKFVDQAHKYLLAKKPPTVMEYLKSRGWDKSIETFKFGYLPAGDSLKQFMIGAYTKKPILKNLISISDDKVADRLIIPVLGKHETILGVIHRAISDKDIREKYGKHFIKCVKRSSILYNAVHPPETIYLVEGQSSVITMQNHGLDAVAIMGSHFSELQYNVLVKAGVTKIILCFDGDGAGEECLNKAIELVQKKPDVKIFVKKLAEGLDPDDIILKDGAEAFKSLPEISLYKYQLDRLVAEEDEREQEGLKESVYSLIVTQSDSITRDRMLELFVKRMKVQKTALLHELKKFECLNSATSDISVTEVLEAQDAFRTEVEKFEERVWRSDGLLGVSTGFPIFDEEMDGLQDGLHEIGGVWNIGKSAFMISIAINMLKNPNVHVLYFSIDDPIQRVTIPRLLANLAELPINLVANPYKRIQQNETISEEERMSLLEKREEALRVLLSDYADRFMTLDASHGDQLDFVEKMVKVRKVIAGEKKLIVFVDFLHMVACDNLDGTELLTRVGRKLKHMTSLYNVPIITTVEGTKDVGGTNDMKDKQIKGSVTLQYGADTILLLNSDFYSNPNSKMYFRDPNTGDAKPIVRVHVSKNKISGFKGNIFYEFNPEFSKFKECSEEGQRKYRREAGSTC